MRRIAGAAIAAGALAGAAPAPAAETGVRTCPERAEGSRPAEFAPAGSVTVGRVAFRGLSDYADPEKFAATYNPHLELHVVKSPVAVRANRNVKLSIPAAQRTVAGLGYDSRNRTARPGHAASVRLLPCPPRTRAFGYDGFVGRVTLFSGGFSLTGPACLVVEARVRGREPVRRAISFGMGERCAAA